MKCDITCVVCIWMFCFIKFFFSFSIQKSFTLNRKPMVHNNTESVVRVPTLLRSLQAPSHVRHRGTLNINPCIFTYLTMQLNYSIFSALWHGPFLTDCTACSLLRGHFTAGLHSVYTYKFHPSACCLISNSRAIKEKKKKLNTGAWAWILKAGLICFNN